MTIDANWSNVVLALQFEGSHNQVVFPDKKFSLVPSSVSGQVSLKNTIGNPFGAGVAGSFDGSGDIITYASSTDFNLGSGAYTIEFWVYRSGANSEDRLLMFGANGSTASCQCNFRSNGEIWFFPATGSPASGMAVGAGSYTLNAWHHVAYVIETTTVFAIFVDGTRIARSNGGAFPSQSYTFAIGGDTGRDHNGYVYDLRITKGVAKYLSSTYTVPTSLLPIPKISGTIRNSAGIVVPKTAIVIERSTQKIVGGAIANWSGVYSFEPSNFNAHTVIAYDELFDPYWNRVSFASSMTGLDTGVIFTTQTGETLTKTGTVTTTTTSPTTDPFGTGSSTKFTGANNYLSTAIDPKYILSTKYTIETWLYLTAFDGTMNGVCFIGDSTSNNGRSQVEVTPSGAILLTEIDTAGSTIISLQTAASLVTLNTWVHIACVRMNQIYYIFFNGLLVSQSKSSVNTSAMGNKLHLGLSRSSNVIRGITGNLRDFRITLEAKYKNPFTVPSTQLLVNPTGTTGLNAVVKDRIIPG